MNIQVRVLRGPGSAAALRQMEAQMTRLDRATLGAAAAGGRMNRWLASGHLEKYGKNLQWTGRQIEYNFTLPLALAAGAATKWAMDNERAMTRVRKVYGDASMSTVQMTEETNKLGEAFRVLSDRFGETLEDVTEIGAMWAQVGAQGVAVARATRASLELMILGEMEAVEATEALIAVQSQYGLSTLELRDAIGQLNAIENATATRLGDLVKSIQRAGGSARNAGVDIRHLAAMTASLVPATGKAERAGNALRTIIDRLAAPTKQAVDVLQEAGVAVNSASWHSMNFTERLTHVSAALNEMSTAAKAQANSVLWGRWQVARASTLLADFANENGRYAKALEVTSDATRNLGEESEYMLRYQKEIAIFLASQPQAFKILTQQLKNLMTEAVGPLIPAMLGLYSRIVGLVRWFTNLSPRVQQLTLALLVFIAVTGPLIRYAGALILLLTRLYPVFMFLHGAVSKAAWAVGWLGTNLNVILRWPFSAVAASFGVLWRAVIVGAQQAGAAISFFLAQSLRAFTVVHGAIVALVARWPSIMAAVVAGLSTVLGATGRAIQVASLAFVAILSRGMAGMMAAWRTGWMAIHATTTWFLPLLMRGVGIWMTGLVASMGMAALRVAETFIALGATLPAILARVQFVIQGFFAAVALVVQNFARLWPYLAAQVSAGLVAAHRAIIGFIAPMMLAMDKVMTGVVIAAQAGMTRLRTVVLTMAWWTMEGMLRLQAAIPAAFTAMWTGVIAAFNIGWNAVAWVSTVGMARLSGILLTLPQILAGIGPALAALGATVRAWLVALALAWHTSWRAMVMGASTMIMRLPFFLGRAFTAMIAMTWAGVRAMGAALLGWPGLIIAAVTGLLYVIRDDVGGAISWLGRMFTRLPEFADAGLRGVVRVFQNAARAIWDVIKFIFNPFAAMNQSQTAAPAATPGALEADTVNALRRQKGGEVPGTGPGDKVPALLESGEFVVQRSAVQKYGIDRLQALNEGLVQKFQRGGLVRDEPPELGRFRQVTAGARGVLEARERGEQRSIVVGAAPGAGPAFDAMVASIGRLTGQLERLRGAYAAQSVVVDRLKASLDAANTTLDNAETRLRGLQERADAARDALAGAESKLAELARTPIAGMRQMSDAIFENEMAQKKLRLEMLKIEQAGGSIEDVRKRLAGLQGDIESLRSERETLRQAGAGSDILGGLDEQIGQMEKARDELESGGAASQYDELQKQLDALALQGQILQLEQSITFDPLTRQIEQMTDTMDEIPFDQLVQKIREQQQEVSRLRGAWETADEAMRSQQATVDALRARRDAIQETYDVEKGRLDGIADSYSRVEDQIRSMESAMSGFVQQAEAARRAAEAAAKEAKGPEVPPHIEALRSAMGAESFDIPGGDVGMLGVEEGSIDDFIAEIMDEMQTSFGNFDLFAPLKKQWNRLWTWLRDNIPTVIGAFVGAVGGHIVGAGLGAKIGGALGTVFGPLGTVIGGLLGAAFGMGVSWLLSNFTWDEFTTWLSESPLANLWDIVGDGVMLLVDRFRQFWTDLTLMLTEEFAKWEETFESGRQAFARIMEWLGVFWEWLTGLFGEGETLRLLWEGIWQALVDVVGPILDTVIGFIQGLFQTIRGVFDLIFAIINGEWDVAWQAVLTILGGVWNAIFALLSGFIGVLIGIGKTILSVILAPFKAVWNFLVGNSLIPDLINSVLGWFRNLVAWLAAPFKALWNLITTQFNNIKTFIAGVWSAIWTKIQGTWTLISTTIRRFIEGIRAVWETTWAAIRDFLGGVWDAVWLKISTILAYFDQRIRIVVGTLKSWWDLIWGGIKSTIVGVWDGIWTKIATVIGNVNTRLRTIVGTMKAWWDGVWSGVGGTISRVMGAVQTKVETVTEAMRRAFRATRDGIGNAVDGIKKRLSTPINWVINTAYNNGIRKFWNAIASKIGMNQLGSISPIELNRGGKVPGQGNGDTVPAMLTPGEFVVNKRAAQAIGPEVLKMLNRADSHGINREDISHHAGGYIQHFAEGGWVTGRVGGMHPEFMRRLGRWAKEELNRPYNIGSGYRSLAEQARLYARWLARVPGQAPAAPPGSSNHNFGLASDGARLGGRNPGKYGLVYPMSYEPWHIEPVGARAMRGGGAGGWIDQPDPGILSSFRTAWNFIKGIKESADDNTQMARRTASTIGKSAIGYGLDKIPLGGMIRKAIGFYNGGTVRGSRNGTLVRVGEQYQDEKIVPLGRTGRDGDGEGRTLNFYGDLSFPNITDADDAEEFIRNLEALVD